jgi:hypothetical protein
MPVEPVEPGREEAEFGGEVAVRCGMFSACGCSVPMVVTPVSEALPALDSA